jgi:DNA-binding LacI/PurR family transcriptional regulator
MASIRQIAARAGVSIATVSRALRHDPRTAEATRERILALAREMGYRPDPAMAALISTRWKETAAPGVPVAYLTFLPDPLSRSGIRVHLPGVEAMAGGMGLRLVRQNVQRAADLPAILETMCARGISGILIDRFSVDDPVPANADWSPFAVVSLDRRFVAPGFHTVTQDAYSGALEVFRRVVERGYRRILALMFHHVPAHPDDEERDAALALARTRAPPGVRIEAREHISLHPDMTRTYLEWIASVRPDCLVAFNGAVVSHLDAIGYRVPEKFGLAILSRMDEPDAYDCTGWQERHDAAAEVAVRMLDRMVRRGERGVPGIPTETRVPGVWYEGSTLGIPH